MHDRFMCKMALLRFAWRFLWQNCGRGAAQYSRLIFWYHVCRNRKTAFRVFNHFPRIRRGRGKGLDSECGFFNRYGYFVLAAYG
ncbi:MAG: hypothetical protein ACFWUD_01960 [Thermocaproicibacter melissae]